MKKVLIIGSGIGGSAAAIAFSKIGYKVTILEKSSTIFTEGAGILLYSNALKSLQYLEVLDEVLSSGHIMAGNTLFYDDTSMLLGSVKYTPIDPIYPAYVGIDRQKFLEILYKKALDLGAEFHFNYLFSQCDQYDNTISVDDKFSDYDLMIAADGTNSHIRNLFWSNSKSVYSGFGLYHSMHDLHPEVSEKITVVMPGKRFGIIPISKNKMYVWGSIPEPVKKYIIKSDQHKTMYNEFKNLSGFLKEVIDDLGKNTYVHYTSVDEVTINDPWHKKRIVLLGDAAHASLPFMAQGGAMAIQDACVLSRAIKENNNIEQALADYKAIRKPVVDVVQQMSRAIGLSYGNKNADLEKIQTNLENFYSNQNYFK